MVATALNQRLTEVVVGTAAESAGWTVPAATYWPNTYLHFYTTTADTVIVNLYTSTTPGTKRVIASKIVAAQQDGIIYLGNLNPGDKISFQMAATGLVWLEGGLDA